MTSPTPFFLNYCKIEFLTSLITATFTENKNPLKCEKFNFWVRNGRGFCIPKLRPFPTQKLFFLARSTEQIQSNFQKKSYKILKFFRIFFIMIFDLCDLIGVF